MSSPPDPLPSRGRMDADIGRETAGKIADNLRAAAAAIARDMSRREAEVRAEENTNIPCVACAWTPKPGPPQPPARVVLVQRDELSALRALLPEVEDVALLLEAAADKIVALKAERERVRAEERERMQQRINRGLG